MRQQAWIVIDRHAGPRHLLSGFPRRNAAICNGALAGSFSDIDQPASMNMVAHMKTTVDIADDVLLRAKTFAEESETTLRRLIEEGLRRVLDQADSPESGQIDWVTFNGKGLQPEFLDKGWDSIRNAIYKDS